MNVPGKEHGIVMIGKAMVGAIIVGQQFGTGLGQTHVSQDLLGMSQSKIIAGGHAISVVSK